MSLTNYWAKMATKDVRKCSIFRTEAVLTIITWRTGLVAYRHLTKAPVPVRCGHLNAQYTHVEA